MFNGQSSRSESHELLEADSENCASAQQLGGRVVLREKGGRKIEGEGGVSVPIIPFDKIARRSAKNGKQTMSVG